MNNAVLYAHPKLDYKSLFNVETTVGNIFSNEHSQLSHYTIEKNRVPYRKNDSFILILNAYRIVEEFIYIIACIVINVWL